MSELKPCPFCGCRREVKILHQSFGTASVIVCNACKTLFVFPWNKTETTYDLVARWNERYVLKVEKVEGNNDQN